MLWMVSAFVFIAVALVLGVLLGINNGRLKTLRQKDELVSTLVSNEFKSPLSSIQMYAELVLRNKPGSQNEEGLRSILRSSERMKRSLRDLQDAKKMENKSFSLNESINTLPSIVDDTLDAFKTASVERRIRFKVLQPSSLPEIVCDRTRLIQALSHLVQAAMQASPSDREVRVTVEDVFPHAKISIHTEGRIGVNNLQKQLGWNVAKTVVESHKGSLTVLDSVLVMTVPFKTEKKSRLLRVV